MLHFPLPLQAVRLQTSLQKFAGSCAQGMSDLAALLRNRMLVMLGDSMSFQVTEAMHCAAASAVGGVRTVRLRAKAPAAMVRTCRFLMQEAGKERPCGCRASADKAWRASACGLWTSLKDLEERDGHYTSIGFLMPAYNFTFLYDFDRVSKYIYESRCYVCDALPRRGGCGAPLPTGPHRRRGLLDHCATTQPLPSRVELIELGEAEQRVQRVGVDCRLRRRASVAPRRACERFAADPPLARVELANLGRDSQRSERLVHRAARAAAAHERAAGGGAAALRHRRRQ